MAADLSWDAYVLANLESSDNDRIIRELREKLTALQVEDVVKTEYCLAYLALARMREDVETSNNAYSDLVLNYEKRIGIIEMNLPRYTIRLFHAVLKNDNSAIDELLTRKADLSYMNGFPGVLRDLVKRRALGDSTVKMDGVAELYAPVLIHVLKGALNYRDLGNLALSDDPRYKRYKDAIYDRMRRATDSDVLVLVTERLRHLKGHISWYQYSGASVILLVEYIASMQGNNFSLFYEDVENLVDLLSEMSTISASQVPNLLQYVTRMGSYMTFSGEERSCMIDVPLSAVPLGRNNQPLLIYSTNPDGSVKVQKYMLRLTTAYTR